MIFQGDVLIIILGLIIGTLILFLMLYVAEMYIISKSVARDRKLMTLLAAFLGVLFVPLIISGINIVFGAIGELMALWQSPLGISPRNYLLILSPVFAYLIFWAICKFLIDTTWEKSGWVALVGLVLLFLVYTIFPMIPQNLPFTIPI